MTNVQDMLSFLRSKVARHDWSRVFRFEIIFVQQLNIAIFVPDSGRQTQSSCTLSVPYIKTPPYFLPQLAIDQDSIWGSTNFSMKYRYIIEALTIDACLCFVQD